MQRRQLFDRPIIVTMALVVMMVVMTFSFWNSPSLVPEPDFLLAHQEEAVIDHLLLPSPLAHHVPPLPSSSSPPLLSSSPLYSVLPSSSPSTSPSTSPSSSPSSSPSPSPSLSPATLGAPAPWVLDLNTTRERLLARHREYQHRVALRQERLCGADPADRLPAPVPLTKVTWWETPQSHSLHDWFDGVPEILTLSCAHFDPDCLRWAQDADPQLLVSLYNMLYVDPDFRPSTEAVRHFYEGHAQRIMDSFAQGRADVAREQRMESTNPFLPEVAVVFDGIVAPASSIFSRDITIHAQVIEEPWADQAKEKGYPSTYEYLLCNRQELFPDMLELKEIAVLYHVHQHMFYHQMMDQYMRFFAFLPYLQQHPEIPILLYSEPSKLDSAFFSLVNISLSRIIYAGKAIKADVIYYPPEFHRHEVPAIGLLRTIQLHMWRALGLAAKPGFRPWSALLDPSLRQPVEQFFALEHDNNDINDDSSVTAQRGFAAESPLEVNVMFIVRSRTRVVINHNDARAAVNDVLAAFPAKMKRVGAAAERFVKFNYREHHPADRFNDTFALYAQSDIIIGPHGAGFVHLVSARPGAHVIELVGGYAQNMIVTARFGGAYHGVVANRTTNGTSVAPHDYHYVVDVPQLRDLVESILDARFLRADNGGAAWPTPSPILS